MAKGDAEKSKARLEKATKNALGKGINPGIESQKGQVKRALEQMILDKDKGDQPTK